MSPRDLGLACTAHTVNIQSEPIFSESSQVRILQCLHDIRNAQFYDLAANSTNLMTMVVVVVTSLVLGAIVQTVTNHQSQFQKESQRVIESSPAHPEILLFQATAQFIK